MAEQQKQETTKLVKQQKREWAQVIAPKSLQNQEVGEIAFTDPNTIAGRQIRLNADQFSGGKSNFSQWLTLQITEVKGKTAYTRLRSFEIVKSFVSKMARTETKNIDFVQIHQCKDAKIKYKFILFSNKRIPHRVSAKTQVLISKIISDQLSKKESEEVMSPKFIKNLEKQIQKDTRKIYPFKKILITRVVLL